MTDATEYQRNRSIELARLGSAFAHGKCSLDDAYTIMRELRAVTGEYPLITIDVDGVLTSAAYRWSNGAEEIRPFAEEACERVYRKWDSDGETRSAAEEWALDLIGEYAAADGVELTEGEREEED